MLQGVNLKRKEMKNDMGRPSFSKQGPLLYFQRELLYPELYIEQSEKCSQLNIPSVLTFIDTRFLPARVLFFVHYLLAWRPVDIL